MPEKKLSVIVTGGASGIGKSVVELCLSRNYKVGIIDIDEQKGALLKKKYKDNLKFVKADVTNENDLKQAFQFLKKTMPSINGCVTCAGKMASRETIENNDLEDFRDVMDNHISGTFLTCKIAGSLMMEKKGGSIVTISSVLAIRPGPVLGYGSGKAAILNLTQSLAVHWAKKNIRINTICPGWVDTPMIRKQEKQGRDLSHILNFTPMGRMAKPKEIAEIILFLLSPLSSAMTGSAIVADCGITLAGGYLPYGDLPN